MNARDLAGFGGEPERFRRNTEEARAALFRLSRGSFPSGASRKIGILRCDLHRCHTSQNGCINFIHLDQSPCRLCEPSCAGRVQFDAWQIGQSLLDLPVISASSFVGDPINRPLPEPIYQVPVALGGIGELLLAACGMDIDIKGRF
jgi:hypothetical protein